MTCAPRGSKGTPTPPTFISAEKPGPGPAIQKKVRCGWCGLQKNLRSVAANFKKTADRLLKILKKVRVPSRQLQKKSGCVGEASLEKSGIVRLSLVPHPRIIIAFSGGAMPDHAPICKKSSMRLVRITKKPQVRCCEFQKNSGSVAANFKKTADRLLRIPEKERVAS